MSPSHAPHASHASAPRHGVAIGIRQLRHAFGGNTVLNGIDLDIPAGTILALLGPSGCGKSTLLKSLAGLLQPDAGSIRFGERVVHEARRTLPPEQRDLGMVFQDYALWPHMTVAGNICLSAANARRAQGRTARARGRSAATCWPARLRQAPPRRSVRRPATACRPGARHRGAPPGAAL
nr:ATP-binding cassette domain-containing protein [Kerstersia gyiorum]